MPRFDVLWSSKTRAAATIFQFTYHYKLWHFHFFFPHSLLPQIGTTFKCVLQREMLTRCLWMSEHDEWITEINQNKFDYAIDTAKYHKTQWIHSNIGRNTFESNKFFVIIRHFSWQKCCVVADSFKIQILISLKTSAKYLNIGNRESTEISHVEKTHITRVDFLLALTLKESWFTEFFLRVRK